MARDQDSQGSEAMNEAEERAIREKLRASGWDKNKRKKHDGSDRGLSRQEDGKDRAEYADFNDKRKKEKKKSDRNEKDYPKSDRRKKRSSREYDRDSELSDINHRPSSTKRSARHSSRDHRSKTREFRKQSGRSHRSRSKAYDRDRTRGERGRGRDRERNRDRRVNRSKRKPTRRRSHSQSPHSDTSPLIRRSRSASLTRKARKKSERSKSNSRTKTRADAKSNLSPLSTDKKASSRKASEESDTLNNDQTREVRDTIEDKSAIGTSQLKDTEEKTAPLDKKSESVEKQEPENQRQKGARKKNRHSRSVSQSRSKSKVRSKSRPHSRSFSRSRRGRRAGRRSSRSTSSRGRGRHRHHISRSRSVSKRRSRSRRRDRRDRRDRGRHQRLSDSRSRSRSASRVKRHRSKSEQGKKKRDANSSPEPHEHPPVSGDGTPSITQLMQQYPTLSLQDIIAKMQASNVTMAAAVAMKPARELYVGNLPATITGPQLQEFLGTIIQQVGLSTQPGNPILSVWISTDGHFAFCEMRSVEECNLALLLNQLPLLGQPLKFGRPRSFMGPPQPMPIVSARTQTALVNLGCTPNPVWFASPDVTSFGSDPMGFGNGLNGFLSSSSSSLMSATALADSLASLPSDPNATQLLMSNIPGVLAEEQVKELVQPFGELRFFKLIKDPITGQSTGTAFFEYQENQVTTEALNGLDGLDIGGVKLSVRRAPDATKYPQIAVLMPGAAGEEPGPVLRMANMVSEDELKNDEEFADLKEDVEEECKRFGTIIALDIPRSQDGEEIAGTGNIFVRYSDTKEATAAQKALCGRKFGGNVVKVTYFSLSKFEAKEYS
uniref:Splicing factor U2af large subunit putative n=1 Tax=Albugo laibachii Nc14 TaxID=890382 RepID=F0VYR3_9STRA|nr:splicing factor U2af large subunit putative [Albugo laibachii Nc14]|eukprot:CCA13927.1 splicing factor U2af large subunit putative [Albugo laibachii Nc14]